MISTEFLDGLEREVRARHVEELGALATVRRMMGCDKFCPDDEPVAAAVAETGPARPAAAGKGPRLVVRKAVEKKKRGESGSKTVEAAREWLDGLKVGTQFTIGELSGKVAAQTGVGLETVKIRMYAWLGYVGDRGEVVKVERGLYRKASPEKKESPTNGVEPAGGGKETWREKMERLRVLHEEARPAATEGTEA